MNKPVSPLTPVAGAAELDALIAADDLGARLLRERRVLRLSEFCTVLGRSRAWAMKHISSGHIHSIKVGGGRMVPVDEVERIAKHGFEVAPGTTTRIAFRSS